MPKGNLEYQAPQSLAHPVAKVLDYCTPTLVSPRLQGDLSWESGSLPGSSPENQAAGSWGHRPGEGQLGRTAPAPTTGSRESS